MTKPWKSALDETRKLELQRALEDKHGNITHAGELLGISHAQMTRLVACFALKEYAAKLRLDGGAERTLDGPSKGLVTGRPKSARSKKLAKK